jgi:zinc/manganese transport system ATP-binding protein
MDGHRWGNGRLSSDERARIDRAIASVGASDYADAPIGRLSGGEQQRLRIAQALVADPSLLLADEPLLSLDLAYQHTITGLLDERRRTAGTPVLFVTHDINPVLGLVDKVLSSRRALGDQADVGAHSETLPAHGRTSTSCACGRVVVVGTPDDQHVHHVDHEH